MPNERAPWEQAEAPDLAELRELILGPERRRLAELERRLDAAGLSRENLAELLPEAIALRSGRDRQLYGGGHSVPGSYQRLPGQRRPRPSRGQRQRR